MHSSKKIIFLLIAFIYLSVSFSCKFKQQQLLFGTQNTANIQSQSNLSAKLYQISPQDILQIRNLQNRKYIVNDAITEGSGSINSTTEQTYLVEADSTVALPMLGHVKVAGLTRTEAAKHIEILYSKELKDPIIELKIINLKVTLLGEVKNQGIYVLTKDHTPLVELIGTAGGLTDKASIKNIKIIRGDIQSPQVFELDLGDIKTLSDPKIMLQNNDIIYIAQNKKAIQSQKLQGTSAVLQPIIALLNTALIIYTLTR